MDCMTGNSVWQNIATGVFTLLGTGLGAWLSYAFNIRKNEKEKSEENIICGNKALYTLFRQINTLANVKANIFDTHEQDVHRFISALPLPYDIDPNISVDCEKLAFFMLSSRDHRQVVFNLSITNDKYKYLVLLINKRSQYYAKAKESFEKFAIPDGTSLNDGGYKSILGERLYYELKEITDKIYSCFNEDINELENMKTVLRRALLEIYPKGRFIDFARL